MIVSYMNPDPDNLEYYDVVDTYASTSEITIPEDGKTTLRFMLKGKNWDSQELEVLAGEGSDPLQYQKLGTVTLTPADENWTAYTFDLSDMAGKTIRVSFHATQNVGMYFAIDDILVASTGTNAVDAIEVDDMESTVEYYSVGGLRLERPAEGLNIAVTRRSYGTVTSRKIRVKK